MCAMKSDTYSLPARIISVGNPGDTNVRIVASEEIGPKPGYIYAALSHCWGTATTTHPTKLLKENLDVLLLEPIGIQSLSKTIQDAIYICRELGTPYLWIDSMCIIQDDLDDWGNEAAKMGDVYRNAYYTIAAASSTDSSGGCLTDEPLSPMVKVFNIQAEPTEGHENARCQMVVRPILDRRCPLDTSPLHDRDWVFQEQILSSRTIYFSRNQFFWQCRTEQHAEDGLGEGRIFCDKTAGLAQVQFDNSSVPGDNNNADGIWWRWVADYSGRKLTKPSDKLAALIGVTQLYRDKTGDTRLVGLWIRNLQKNLFWARRRKEVVPYEPGRRQEGGTDGFFPNWSWLAASGRIIPPVDIDILPGPLDDDDASRRSNMAQPQVHTVRVADDII